MVTHLAASQLKSIDPDMEADSFDEEITDEEAYHVMLQTRPVKRTGYIVITSDKGLAVVIIVRLLNRRFRCYKTIIKVMMSTS